MCSVLLTSGMYDLMEYKIRPIVEYKRKYKKYTDFEFMNIHLSNDSICKIIKYVFAHTEWKHFNNFTKPNTTRIRYIYNNNKIHFHKYVFDVMCKIIDNKFTVNRDCWNIIKNNLVLFQDLCGNKKLGVIVGSNGRYGNNISMVRILLESNYIKRKEEINVWNINLFHRAIFYHRDRYETVVPTNNIITNVFENKNDYWMPVYKNFDEPSNIRIVMPDSNIPSNIYNNPRMKKITTILN